MKRKFNIDGKQFLVVFFHVCSVSNASKGYNYIDMFVVYLIFINSFYCRKDIIISTKLQCQWLLYRASNNTLINTQFYSGKDSYMSILKTRKTIFWLKSMLSDETLFKCQKEYAWVIVHDQTTCWLSCLH